MFVDGFTNTLSVDYSQVVIEKMRSLYEQSPALADTFVVGDCRDLRKQCREGEFDVILDKGTLDAILCGTDSNKHSAAMLAEMHRLLRPGECRAGQRSCGDSVAAD
jgi:RAT1-interacting protein